MKPKRNMNRKTNKEGGEMRPETGPTQFGDDWPGIFIRGDNAFFYLKICEALSANNPIAQGGLEGLKDLLQSCDTQNKKFKLTNKLKSFEECENGKK